MPAPKARSAASFSCTRTVQPRWRSAIAAAKPANPAPAISACIGGTLSRAAQAGGGSWAPGVEREISTSSGVMSAGMEANSGVLR